MSLPVRFRARPRQLAALVHPDRVAQVFRASRGAFRRWRAGFSLLVLLAVAVLPAAADDGCVPIPEDGIVCDEDDGPHFVVFWAFDVGISGDVTESWDSDFVVQSWFSHHHGGGNSSFFRYYLGEGSRLSIAGTDDMIYVGTLSGPGSLRLLSGTLRFQPSGNYVHSDGYDVPYYSLNTYSGGTEVAGGTLLIRDDGNLGSGSLSLTGTGRLETIDGGSVRGFSVDGTDTGLLTDSALTVTGAVTGEGRLNKLGAGTVSFSQANTYSGGTVVAAGRLSLGNDTHLGAATATVALDDGAGLILAEGFASSARQLELTGGVATLDVAAGTARWKGATSGLGKLSKQGAGTLVLSGGIGHTGGADIAAGTLEVSVTSDLGGTGSTSWSGPITGDGDLIKSGNGTFVLSGAATLTGSTTVNGGTLRTSAANVLSADSALFIVNGSTVDLAGYNQTVGDLDSYDISHRTFDAGTLQLGGATLTTLTRVTNNWAGALTGSGDIVKQGTATANWSGANTFSGTLTVAAGTLHAATADTLSANAVVSVSSGATLDLDSRAQATAGLAGAGTVTLGSATLTLHQAANTTFSGVVTGTGALVKSGNGTLTLTGTHTFTGATSVNGGQLAVDGSLASSCLTTIHSGATLRGSGIVGALTVASGGILAPGNSPGTLFAGNTTFASGGILQFELADATGIAGSGWDLLSISGTLTLSSTDSDPFTLAVASLDGLLPGHAAHFDPAADYSFTFLTTTGGVSGFSADKFTIDRSLFQNSTHGLWSVAQSGNALTLNYTASAIPEPSTYAALLGASALALAAWRRRR